jgi:hypothetical protein
MTDFLEDFTLQNTNSNPQLRDLTLFIRDRYGGQNTEVRTENHTR